MSHSFGWSAGGCLLPGKLSLHSDKLISCTNNQAACEAWKCPKSAGEAILKQDTQPAYSETTSVAEVSSTPTKTREEEAFRVHGKAKEGGGGNSSSQDFTVRLTISVVICILTTDFYIWAKISRFLAIWPVTYYFS